MNTVILTVTPTQKAVLAQALRETALSMRRMSNLYTNLAERVTKADGRIKLVGSECNTAKHALINHKTNHGLQPGVGAMLGQLTQKAATAGNSADPQEVAHAPDAATEGADTTMTTNFDSIFRVKERHTRICANQRQDRTAAQAVLSFLLPVSRSRGLHGQ